MFDATRSAIGHREHGSHTAKSQRTRLKPFETMFSFFFQPGKRPADIEKSHLNANARGPMGLPPAIVLQICSVQGHQVHEHLIHIHYQRLFSETNALPLPFPEDAQHAGQQGRWKKKTRKRKKGKKTREYTPKKKQERKNMIS